MNARTSSQRTAPTAGVAAALMFAGFAHGQQQSGPDTHQHADHAGHEAPDTTLPRTPVPPVTDADRAAARAPEDGHPAHDNRVHGLLLFDQIEVFDDDGEIGQAWDVEGWVGTDTDRLWLRSDGERSGERTGSADLEILYGRSVSAWWDLLAGIRHDAKPEDARTFAAVGIQGTAPQWLELEITGYLGEGGRTALRFDAHYELRFTGRLILQWQLEADAYGRDDATRGLASGLAIAGTGARLRYEITRRFAPYVGIHHERAVGDTADLRRAGGGEVTDTRFVAGIRTWF